MGDLLLDGVICVVDSRNVLKVSTDPPPIDSGVRFFSMMLIAPAIATRRTSKRMPASNSLR